MQNNSSTLNRAVIQTITQCLKKKTSKIIHVNALPCKTQMFQIVTWRGRPNC